MTQTAYPPGDVEQLAAALKRANERIRILENELKWQKKLFSNPAISATAKLAIWRAAQEFKRSKPNEQGLYRIYIQKMAEDVGISAATFGRSIKYLAEEAGAFERRTEQVTNEQGERITRVYIAPTEALKKTPDQIQPAAPRNHGGRRVVCTSCGSDRLLVQKQVICADCGTILDDKVRPLNKDTQSEEEETDEQLVQRLNEEQEANEQEVEQAAASPDEQLVQRSPLDHSSPLLPVTTTREYVGLSADEIDDFLASWLRKGIGRGQLITATGNINSSLKYISLPAGAQPNMRAYLAGDPAHIYGSNPLRSDGTSYILEFDFDNQDESRTVHDARHVDYLTKLAAGGVAAMYFPRRLGRGHFLICFDTPVNPEAAYRLVTSLCPELATVEEVYPIRDKVNQRISWPFYQRIGGQVIECRCIAMLPSQPSEILTCVGLRSDRSGLAAIIAQAVTPAALAQPFTEAMAREQAKSRAAEQEVERAFWLVDLAPGRSSSCYSAENDLAPALIAAFNRLHTWEEITEPIGGIHNGRFRAVWRGEQTASVVIDPDGKFACDYGRCGSYPKKLDRFEVWCLINGKDKRAEIRERTAELRNGEVFGV